MLSRHLFLGSALLAFAAGSFAFDLQGHRGARGLKPENSLPAFQQALDLGVDTLETDIGITADGVVVITHDPYLNPFIVRGADGQWVTGPKGALIKSMTAAQLAAYDVGRIRPGTPYAKTFETQHAVDGTRIPTLMQLFDLVKSRNAQRVRFNIETKINPTLPEETVSPEAMAQALLKTIRDAGMASRVSIQSFDWRTLQIVQKLEPAIPTVYLTVQTANNDNTRDTAWTAGYKIADHGSVPRMVKAAGGAVWAPNQGSVTEALVKEAQALGLQVIPWTVNDPSFMERFLGWGVDGIITDYPDRLRELMARRNMPLPPPNK